MFSSLCPPFFDGYACVNASVNSSCAHPPPPRQLRGICPPCHSRGGALANLAPPGVRAFAYPRATPRAFDTHVVSTRNPNMEDFVGKDLQFVADWLICQGLDKHVEFH